MEESHTSGVSRFCNSVFTAFCIAPTLILGMTFMLGWNEKRAVCEMRALVQGEEEVNEIGCTDKGEKSGELVMLQCDLSQTGLTPVSLPGTDFTFNYVGPLQVSSEMLQCVESSRSETTKDSVGGGTTTRTYYSYTVEWKSSHINSGSFKGKYLQGSSWSSVCGVENPSWPSGLPTSGRRNDGGDITAGAFVLGDGLKSYLSLTSPVRASSASGSWTLNGDTYTKLNMGMHGIGDVRVSFKGLNWAEPRVTVLGQNNDGTIGKWTADDSWLCSGFTLLGLEHGNIDKERFFDNLQAGSQGVTYVLRFVGFILMWCAFKCCFGPLGVAADCIPCIGPCIGDAIETIGCIVSCPPACACALGVIGIVWVAMRPMVGIPLMIIFCCVMSGFAGYVIYKKQQKGGEGGGGEDNA